MGPCGAGPAREGLGSAHPVVGGAGQLTQLALEVQVNGEVQVALWGETYKHQWGPPPVVKYLPQEFWPAELLSSTLNPVSGTWGMLCTSTPFLHLPPPQLLGIRGNLPIISMAPPSTIVSYFFLFKVSLLQLSTKGTPEHPQTHPHQYRTPVQGCSPRTASWS